MAKATHNSGLRSGCEHGLEQFVVVSEGDCDHQWCGKQKYRKAKQFGRSQDLLTPMQFIRF
eukprot:scaffold25072_cov152-Cylindrotheca_fusiformis.AAC.2